MTNPSVRIALSLPPTVNHCYRNAPVPTRNKTTGKTGVRMCRVLTSEAETWMQAAGYVAKAALKKAGWVMPEAGKKVVVELRVAWPDNRRRDMNNLHKLTADVLEHIAYVDDRYALLRDMDYRVDPKHPALHLTVFALESPPTSPEKGNTP